MSSTRLFSGLLGLLLLVPTAGQAQSVFSPCRSNASNNATVVLPPSTGAAVGPSDDALAGGSTPDSIAVFTPDGTCVAVSAWSPSEGVTLSVAGAGSFVTDGLSASDSLQFRIYDASRDAVDRAIVEYKSCGSVSASLQPLCRERRGYRTDALYVPAAIGSYSLAFRIEGSPGADAADAGWRFVGPPTASEIPAEDLRLGGEPPDFDLPEGHMLMRWNDAADAGEGPTGAYEGLSASDALAPGRGYALYLFDEPPYALDPALRIDVASPPGLRSADSVTVEGLTQTARWHLLANPYPSGYELSALSDLAANGFQTTVQRYDATTGSWVVETQSETDLAGWQAFFVERTDFSGGQGATTLTFSPEGRVVDAPFVGATTNDASSPQRRAVLELALRVTSAAGDTTSYDRAARIVFDDRATTAWDAYDATKLDPLSSSYALLAPQGPGRTDAQVDKAVESRPWPSTRQSVPVRVRTQGIDAGTATLSTTRWTLPAPWSAQLIDQHQGETYPLDSASTISLPLSADSTRDTPRFALQVAPSGTDLPLDLAALQARLADGAVRLRWEMASPATSQSEFHVERRTVTDTTGTEQASSWTEVGAVENDPSSTASTYRYTDRDLPYEAVRYDYRLRRVDADGTVRRSRTVQVQRPAVRDLTLHASFPNPVRTQATLRYALPRAQHVRIEMFDLLGRRIQTLVDGRRKAGRHQTTLDASRLASGIYFYRLQTEDTAMTRKMTVVR